MLLWFMLTGARAMIYGVETI
jgi:hypothetical protein